MGSWFLGNRAENGKIFSDNMTAIISSVRSGREGIFPKDPVRQFTSLRPACDSSLCYVQAQITSSMSDTAEFKESVQYLENTLKTLAGQLTEHSVPFYSPRYAGHMCTDLSCKYFLLNSHLLGYAHK